MAAEVERSRFSEGWSRCPPKMEQVGLKMEQVPPQNGAVTAPFWGGTCSIFFSRSNYMHLLRFATYCSLGAAKFIPLQSKWLNKTDQKGKPLYGRIAVERLLGLVKAIHADVIKRMSQSRKP